MNITELQLLVDAGELDRAREMARTLDQFVPENAPDWFNYYKILRKTKLHAQNEIMTTKYVKRHPDDALPRLYLARLLKESRKFRDAETHLNIAIATPVQSSDFWQVAVELYVYLKRWPDAQAATGKVLELDPSNFGVRLNYISLLIRNHHKALVEPQCAVIEAQLGNNIQRCIAVMSALEPLGLRKICAAAFERALSILAKSAKPEIWARITAFLKKAPNQRRTERVFAVARECHFENPDVLALVFEYSLRAADHAMALEAGRRLVALKSGLPDLAEQMAELERLADSSAFSSAIWWQNLK